MFYVAEKFEEDLGKMKEYKTEKNAEKEAAKSGLCVFTESGEKVWPPEPVSYTHLDVYKRQISFRTTRGPGCYPDAGDVDPENKKRALTWHPCFPGGDVYKRQMYRTVTCPGFLRRMLP